MFLKLYHLKHVYKRQKTNAFTLVELLIVITVISILAVGALVDYGLAIKKARLAIAVEELLGLFHEAQVFSQSRYSDASSGSTGDLFCWAVVIDTESAPRLLQVPWDTALESCAADVFDGTFNRSLQWPRAVTVSGLEWEIVSVTFGTSTGSTDSLALLFVPPQGDIQVYVDATSTTLLTDVSWVKVYVSYDGATTVALSKTVEITPVTSRFVVHPGIQ